MVHPMHLTPVSSLDPDESYSILKNSPLKDPTVLKSLIEACKSQDEDQKDVEKKSRQGQILKCLNTQIELMGDDFIEFLGK
jgi:hypothetical protein